MPLSCGALSHEHVMTLRSDGTPGFCARICTQLGRKQHKRCALVCKPVTYIGLHLWRGRRCGYGGLIECAGSADCGVPADQEAQRHESSALLPLLPTTTSPSSMAASDCCCTASCTVGMPCVPACTHLLRLCCKHSSGLGQCLLAGRGLVLATLGVRTYVGTSGLADKLTAV